MIDNKKKYSWQAALTDLITDPKELINLLELDESLVHPALLAADSFSLKVPRGFALRMKKGDPHDPLLKQVLPIHQELLQLPGYQSDPLAEGKANPVPGLLHKYHGRVLVMLTSACAIHCRYCFRRHFPYDDNHLGRHGWENMMAYIKQDETISEVILSGGDPLSVSDKLLTQFSEKLCTIAHVKRLRIHTRIPIVLPERITPELIAWLQQLTVTPSIVVHANHANEIDAQVKASLLALREAGITVLNQTVLLKGVNDSAEALIALSEALFAAGVLPYYLHVLDKVEGAAHFDMERKEAIQLHAALSARLPGYLVPRLVCEEAHATSKTLLR